MACWLRAQACVLCVIMLSSCSFLDGSFSSDQLIGGKSAHKSALLGVRLPAGLTLYPSHGYSEQGLGGKVEGLETFRGRLSPALLSADLFSALHDNGWRLRLSLRKGGRSLSLYQKNEDYAVITLRGQGALTVLEIWAGASLPEGAALNLTPRKSQAEGLGEADADSLRAGPEDGKTETWGSSVEEREL